MNQRVHRTWLSWGAVSSVALLLLVSPQPIRADDAAFSPQAVFALPDRANIDSRCKDAIVFAEKASHGTDAILIDDAIAAANQFAACFRLPKLNPDADQQRYLMLAAATALYLAATKTSGDEAAALYKKADSIGADQRNPHFSGQKLKFTEIATQLRASAESHLTPAPPPPPKPAV